MALDVLLNHPEEPEMKAQHLVLAATVLVLGARAARPAWQVWTLAETRHVLLEETAVGPTPVAVAASLVAPSPLGPSQPIKVPTSTVHLIDADALVPDSKTSPSTEPGSIAGGALAGLACGPGAPVWCSIPA